MARPSVPGVAVLLVVALGTMACGAVPAARHVASGPERRPLPPPVEVRDAPEVGLADPAFEPLAGARADFGILGGAAYQIEVPDDWNGRLLLWMHGFEEFAPMARVTPPDFRRALVADGFAWAASSFSSTSLVPGRAADETAALWDHFVRTYRVPERTYVAGLSMGGWATHVAAERYGDRFDGALAFCGAVGAAPGLRVSVEQLVVGAYVAGVSQAEYDAAPRVDILVEARIRPALDDPRNRARFERLMVDLTGGPRAYARAGLRDEEETNWERAVLLAASGLAPRRDEPYRLGPDAPVTSAAFDRDALVVRTDEAAAAAFADGTEVTGELAMPLLTLHTTGDGQVPIGQAQILRERVEDAGRGRRLVQRVIEDPGHCGFTTAEQEDAFAALVRWVEHGRRPAGTDLDVDDLRELDRTFELAPRRSGRPDGAVTLRGRATRDGEPFDARWMGAVVLHRGRVTPCNTSLPPIDDGRYEIAVYRGAASAGCGRPGARIVPWTYFDDVKHYATEAVPWPRRRTTNATVAFHTAAPAGAAPAVTEFSGEVYGSDGERFPAGTLVEAVVGTTRCGVASVRATGFYILAVVGDDTVPGCASGGPIIFRVDGTRAEQSARNAPADSAHLDLTVARPARPGRGSRPSAPGP
jgi:pimeloyl-ACP methyl ester carboxylesterase